MTGEITTSTSDGADRVQVVEIQLPGVPGAPGPASVFIAASPTGDPSPAALTLRPIAEGSSVYGLTVTTLE